MQVVKYELKIRESDEHVIFKHGIFNLLKSGNIRGFKNHSNQVNIKGDRFKIEYPFFTNCVLRDCNNCSKESCIECHYIPNTCIKCISDIVVMDHNGKVKQVIEIECVNFEEAKERLKRKVEYYKSQKIDVIIVKTKEDFADHGISNEKYKIAQQIILGDK
jgi:hypothetical protein